MTLGEAGDLAAAPGSLPWAVAVRLELQALIHRAEFDRSQVGHMRHLFVKHAGYKQLRDQTGRPFRSYRAFCTERPPWGLGYDPDVLEQLIVGPATPPDDQAQAALPLAQQGRPTTGDKGSVSIFVAGARRDSDYLTARIARDHPAILERMKAGDFKSVRAAALAAGIITPTVQIPLDPARAARTLRRRFTAEQIAALVAALARDQGEG